MADTPQKAADEHMLIAAPLTPLHENGELNLPFLDQYADYLVKTFINGVFINGSLGEGMSMTLTERKQLTEEWIRVAKGRLQVIVHVGCNCLKDSQELARHAQEHGADAIAAFSPSYYKPENEEVLVEYMAELAAAAPKLPFYYYEINFSTGVYINVPKFMRLAKERIPSLAGIKHSSRELTSLHNCILLGGGLKIYVGTDAQYLTAITLGAHGDVANSYLGNIFHDIKEAFDKGDLAAAREHQTKAQVIMNIRAKYGGGGSAAKSIFRILTGLEVGPVRLPQRQLTQEEIESMRIEFEEAGLIDVAKPRQ